jgi:hypothetical protein
MSSGDPACFSNAQNTVVGLWAAHGDVLSLQYAGSQALQSDVTRTGRRTLQGLLSDSVSSVQRYVQRSLYDSSTQEMLDWLLGQAEPALLQPAHSNTTAKATRAPLPRKQAAGQENLSAEGPSLQDHDTAHHDNQTESRATGGGGHGVERAQTEASCDESARLTGEGAGRSAGASTPHAHSNLDSLCTGDGGDEGASAAAAPASANLGAASLADMLSVGSDTSSGRNWFGLAGAWRGRGRGLRKGLEGACAREGASLDSAETLSTTSLSGSADVGEDGEDEWELIVKT